MRVVAQEVTAAVEELSRKGGFSPAQWVLGRQPRHGADRQEDDATVNQLGSVE